MGRVSLILPFLLAGAACGTGGAQSKAAVEPAGGPESGKIAQGNYTLHAPVDYPLPAEASSANRQTKPYAITVSGGVSLGSYQAGLNYEILRWLQSSEEKDVLAVTGASAGAINALMTAMSYCIKPEREGDGHIAEIFKRWKDVGIEELAPSDTSEYLPNDLLLSTAKLNEIWRGTKNDDNVPGGDGGCEDDGLCAYFDDTQSTSQRREDRLREQCNVSLGITVTRRTPSTSHPAGVSDSDVAITAPTQRFVIPMELFIGNVDGGTRRLIAVMDEAALSDPDIAGETLRLTPKHNDEQKRYPIDPQSLFDAIKASAAFPGAFGPVELEFYKESATQAAAGSSLEDCSPSNPAGWERCRDYFIDGGVFDNIPISLAKVLMHPDPIGSDKGVAGQLVEDIDDPSHAFFYDAAPTIIYLDPTGRLRGERYERGSDEKGGPKDSSDDDNPLTVTADILSRTVSSGRKHELFSAFQYLSGMERQAAQARERLTSAGNLARSDQDGEAYAELVKLYKRKWDSRQTDSYRAKASYGIAYFLIGYTSLANEAIESRFEEELDDLAECARESRVEACVQDELNRTLRRRSGLLRTDDDFEELRCDDFLADYFSAGSANRLCEHLEDSVSFDSERMGGDRVAAMLENCSENAQDINQCARENVQEEMAAYLDEGREHLQQVLQGGAELAAAVGEECESEGHVSAVDCYENMIVEEDWFGARTGESERSFDGIMSLYDFGERPEEPGVGCGSELQAVGEALEEGGPDDVILVEVIRDVLQCEHLDDSSRELLGRESLAYLSTRGALDGDSSLIALTDRYFPLYGELLRNFGAFVHQGFRRADYLIGRYDGLHMAESGQYDEMLRDMRKPELLTLGCIERGLSDAAASQRPREGVQVLEDVWESCGPSGSGSGEISMDLIRHRLEHEMCSGEGGVGLCDEPEGYRKVVRNVNDVIDRFQGDVANVPSRRELARRTLVRAWDRYIEIEDDPESSPAAIRWMGHVIAGQARQRNRTWTLELVPHVSTDIFHSSERLVYLDLARVGWKPGQRWRFFSDFSMRGVERDGDVRRRFGLSLGTAWELASWQAVDRLGVRFGGGLGSYYGEAFAELLKTVRLGVGWDYLSDSETGSWSPIFSVGALTGTAAQAFRDQRDVCIASDWQNRAGCDDGWFVNFLSDLRLGIGEAGEGGGE